MRNRWDCQPPPHPTPRHRPSSTLTAPGSRPRPPHRCPPVGASTVSAGPPPIHDVSPRGSGQPEANAQNTHDLSGTLPRLPPGGDRGWKCLWYGVWRARKGLPGWARGPRAGAGTKIPDVDTPETWSISAGGGVTFGSLSQRGRGSGSKKAARGGVIVSSVGGCGRLARPGSSSCCTRPCRAWPTRDGCGSGRCPGSRTGPSRTTTAQGRSRSARRIASPRSRAPTVPSSLPADESASPRPASRPAHWPGLPAAALTMARMAARMASGSRDQLAATKAKS
jgi:hypothetical protein